MPLLIAVLLAAATLVTPGTSAADPPSPWHHEDAAHSARIVDLDGRLRLQRASGEAFELGEGARARHTAVREGDRLSTGWNTRLVLDIGPNRVKLDERSELRIRQMDRSAVALDLERGGVVLELRLDESAWRWQVDSAAGRHQPQGAGLFRIDAPDTRGLDAGSATAWRNTLRIDHGDGTLLLPPGRRAERERDGRWQIGFSRADAFAAWAMTPPVTREASEDWDERRPRQWRAAPTWEAAPPPPYPPQPPRVIVLPPPIVVEPAPRVWRVQPEPRDQRPPRVVVPAPAPLPQPDTVVRPARPDRRHHDSASPVLPPPGPQGRTVPAQPQPRAEEPRLEEPRRSQRML